MSMTSMALESSTKIDFSLILSEQSNTAHSAPSVRSILQPNFRRITKFPAKICILAHNFSLNRSTKRRIRHFNGNSFFPREMIRIP